MTFTDAVSQIPIMFFVTLLLLPVVIVAYFVSGQRKRAVPLRNADPVMALTASNINVGRVVTSNILLGVVFGLSLSLLIFITTLGVQWYNSTGLFAVSLPHNTFPPTTSDVLPPHPPSYAQNSSDTAGGDTN